jgi:hypothetical protein
MSTLPKEITIAMAAEMTLHRRVAKMVVLSLSFFFATGRYRSFMIIVLMQSRLESALEIVAEIIAADIIPVIIAGACGSYYEALIKSGANFASSPKRINLHALDPAIVAIKISLTDKNRDIDLLNIIEKTKYGKDSIGGVITKGTMYVGYPRV